MDREAFIQQYMRQMDEIIGDEYDKERILKVIRDSIDANSVDRTPRGHRNLIIVMEELAELSQQVSKELRGNCNKFDLLQELADVQLCIYYIQEICNIDDKQLQDAMVVKSNRVEDGLRKNGQYK